jgi:hypothetical protein
MSTEQDVAPNTQIDSAPDSAPDSPTYTREQVEAREKQARDTAWAEARRAFKADRSNGKQPDKQEAPAKVDNGGGGDALTRALRQRDALDDALAGRPITAGYRTNPDQQAREWRGGVGPEESSAERRWCTARAPSLGASE